MRLRLLVCRLLRLSLLSLSFLRQLQLQLQLLRRLHEPARLLVRPGLGLLEPPWLLARLLVRPFRLYLLL